MRSLVALLVGIAGDASGPPIGFDVEGTVVVDDRGVERLAGDGSFRAIYFEQDHERRGPKMSVRAGRFIVHVPKDSDLGIEELEIEGRPATAAPRRFIVAPEVPIEVTARKAQDVTIHVMDAATRQPLKDVQVLWRQNPLQPDATLPGRFGGEPLVEHADSPIVMKPLTSEEFGVTWHPTLFATAPGYAWGSAKVDVRDRDDVTIALACAGELEVTIAGEVPPLPVDPVRRDLEESAHPYVRVRTAAENGASDEDAGSGKLIAEAGPDPKSMTRFVKVPPGPLVVTLEYGSWMSSPFVLARTEVRIEEGRTARVALKPDAHDDVGNRVPLSGILRVSKATELPKRLFFDPLDVAGSSLLDEFSLHLDRVAGRDDALHFDAGRVRPGRYVVYYPALSFKTTVATGPEGSDHAEIVIGDPADVSLRFVKAATGEIVSTPPRVLWNCWLDGVGSPDLEWCTWDATARLARFRAPAGDVELRLDPSSWEKLGMVGERSNSLVIHVEPGASEKTIALRPVTVVAVRATIDGVAAKWPSPQLVEQNSTLEETGHPDQADHPAPASPTELRFFVPHAGKYTARIATLPGFAPVDPFEIEVRGKERVVTTVPLHRVR